MEKVGCNLFDAVACGDSDIVIKLVSECGNVVNELNDNGYSALYMCCINGDIDIARVLLAYGADLNFREKENGWTPLHRALYGGHVMLSLVLIHAGAKLDSDDRTILKDSANFDSSKKNRTLSRTDSFDASYSKALKDREGFTPMDLLSEHLSTSLNNNSDVFTDCGSTFSVMSFGTADVMLGIPLPNKASDVIKPRSIEDALLNKSIKEIAAARYHSMAIDDCGQVYTWGHGKSGRLGHGNEFTQPLPIIVNALSKVLIRVISCGVYHSMAATEMGELYTWGDDKYGQLGHGGGIQCEDTINNRVVLSPRKVEFLRREFVYAIAAGDCHSICSTTEKEIYTWGSNKYGQLGLKATDISTLQGVVGSFTPKKVGLDCLVYSHQKKKYLNPKQRIILAFESYDDTPDVVEVSASSYSSAVVVMYQDRKTEVYQWGHGVPTPAKVYFVDRSTKTRSLSTGSENGEEFSFASANKLVNIDHIVCGKFHYLAVATSHCVYSWGLDTKQLCGVNNPSVNQIETSMSNSPVPMSMFSMPKVVENLLPENGGGRIINVAAADSRCCAVSDVGNLYTWEYADKEVFPKKVVGIKRAIACVAAQEHTLALTVTTHPSLPLSHIMFSQLNGEGDLKSTVKDTNGNEDEDDVEESELCEKLKTRLDPTPSDDEDDDYLSNKKNVNISSEESKIFLSEVPSLFDSCQHQLAKAVNLKSVLTLQLYADFYNAPLLSEFCTSFIQRNFDTILTQLKPADLAKIIESLPTCNVEPVVAIESEFQPRNKPPTPTKSDGKEIATTCSSGSSDVKNIDSVLDAKKAIKALKKKIADISQLQEKCVSSTDYKLSAEQQTKVDKKQSLQFDLSYVEMLLIRLTVREENAAKTVIASNSEVNNIVSISVGASPIDSTLTKKKEVLIKTTPVEVTPTKAKKSKFISMDSFLAMQEPKQQVSTKITSGASPWKSNVPQLSSLVATDDDKFESNATKEIKSTTTSSSNVLPAPTVRSIAETLVPSKVPLNSSSVYDKSGATQSTPTKPKTTTSTSASPSVSSKCTAAFQPQQTASTTPAKGTKMSLADFMLEPKQTTPTVTPTKSAKGWGNSISVTPSTPIENKSNFNAIQAEEEKLRKSSQITSLKGNSVPWLIERKPRAESLDVVMQIQQIEQMEAESIRMAKESAAAAEKLSNLKPKAKKGNKK